MNVEEKRPSWVGSSGPKEWLEIWTNLGRAPLTIDAYAQGLAEYLLVYERDGVNPLTSLVTGRVVRARVGDPSP